MASAQAKAAATDVPRVLQKEDGDIEALFDRVAPRYDFLNHLLSGWMDVSWRRLLVQSAEVGESGQVLDCATGTGDVLFEFFDQLPYTVGGIGIDFSTAMLERARKKAERLGYQDRALFTRANLLEIPFTDEAFEAVTIAFGIRNVSDPARAINEMVRVCRPGGKVLILEFMRQPPGLSRSLVRFYCRRVMPLVARLFGSDGSAYGYLNESIDAFMTPFDLLTQMEVCGLCECRATNLFMGIATLHVGTKPMALGSPGMRAGKTISEEILDGLP